MNFPEKVLHNTQTPFYLYDLDLLDRTIQACQNEALRHGYHVHYALKANANTPILERMLKYNLGADCVSGNEVKAAFEAGFAPEQIAFAGVGKSDQEIRAALEIVHFLFQL